MFTIEQLSLPGVVLVRPKIFPDPRGYAAVTYNIEEFLKLGITTTFKQDFRSYSVKDVIRGLHFQMAPHEQDKLVRCTEGAIFDVAADIDPASPTFGTYVSAHLTAEDQSMLFVPGKYAHGFCVTSQAAGVEYKIGGQYSPSHARGVAWNDPLLNIAWPTSSPALSDQDKSWPLLSH